jgi:hypothetical protein
MTTIARAWHAAMLALAEAMDLRARGAQPESILELLRHVRELVEIIEEEIGNEGVGIADPDVARMAAAELRRRVDTVAATLGRLH